MTPTPPPPQSPWSKFLSLKNYRSKPSVVLLYSHNCAAGIWGHFYESSDCSE